MVKFTRKDNNNLFHSSKERIDKFKNNFIFKYLRVELQDSYKHLEYVKSDIFIYRQIEKTLSRNIFNTFLRRQETNFNRMQREEQDRINTKINNLRASHRVRDRMKIGNINYNIMHGLDSDIDSDILSAPFNFNEGQNNA